MGLFDFLKPTPVSTPKPPVPQAKPAQKPHTSAPRSGVDCYNYNGYVENYFAEVLTRNFPGYELRRNVTVESLTKAPSPAAPVSGTWRCSCGAVNSGKFCPGCGSRRPEPKPVPAPAGSWICPTCGIKSAGKFCMECGTPRPVSNEWVCSCGSKNKGKFCPECGSKKPEAAAVSAAPAAPVSAPAAAPKSCGYLLSYVLYHSGSPKMAVILCLKNSYRRQDILRSMDMCKKQGVPCLRFFREFRNDEAYIRSRISQAMR